MTRLQLPVLIIAVYLMACGGGTTEETAESAPATTERCPSLVGSWELEDIHESALALSGEYESDPSYGFAPTLKILNETHWMFIRQNADELVHAQGGRYTLESGGFYTEHVLFSAIPENVGQSYHFECEVEGDSIWHHVGGIGDARYDEVWRRIR